jgi:hypothetical protein
MERWEQMKTQEHVATPAEMIASLQKMPADAPIYFDCPHCRKAGGFHRLSIAVMVTTEETRERAL